MPKLSQHRAPNLQDAGPAIDRVEAGAMITPAIRSSAAAAM
jgi:hypothetical protein